MLCRKRNYLRRREARRELKKIQSRVPTGRKKPMRVYLCPLYGNFHLTSRR